MSKPKKNSEVREEYNFAGAIRGKYAARYREGSNIVVLDPDIAKQFKTSAEVNKALRELVTKK